MYLVFDTETTGLIGNKSAPYTDEAAWPRVVQLAWQLHDLQGVLVEQADFLIRPDGFNIPFKAESIHGISTALAQAEGVALSEALIAFNRVVAQATRLVGHNLEYDQLVLGGEYFRAGLDNPLPNVPVIDTCWEDTATLCQLPGGRGGKFKFPKLEELYHHVFGTGFDLAHNATADVEASARVFLELAARGFYPNERLGVAAASIRSSYPEGVGNWGVAHRDLKAASVRVTLVAPEASPVVESEAEGPRITAHSTDSTSESGTFFHVHLHSQFSVLQATARVEGLVKRAVAEGQPAVALTDTGNMMGAFQFVNAVDSVNKTRAEGTPELKALVGYEAFVCRNHRDKSVKDDGFLVPLLALNKKGYQNLAKLSSAGYIDGFYYVPRIDKDLLMQHTEGVVALTGGLSGEIPHLIANVGFKQAEEAFLWYKEVFGDRFYAELNRHGLPEEDAINDALLELCRKHNVPFVPANNAFYLDRTESEAHDILLCVKDSEKKATPIGRGRGFRYGMPNDRFHMTTTAEMRATFSDVPDGFLHLAALLERVETYSLAREVLLPKFDIPVEFESAEDAVDGGKRGENAYLRHLTYEGAKRRYGESLSEEIRERLDFELATIEKAGYPGYFLIVQDFCAAARGMDVSVGPGRGSAAGSAVAYCIGITNVDPIRYDLLFERFLNPDRVSLPDIDIDFDDRGRDKVIQYVIDKYGSSQVAQIITYGSMAAKSSIKDTARVLDLSFADADKMTKSMPDGKSLLEVLTLDDKKLRESLRQEDYTKALELRRMAEEPGTMEALRQAQVLEGSLRNTGIHACGVIITPTDIRELIPVATAKDSAMWCTQFDNAVVESAGLLKMDFLGLKTLTLLKDAVELIQKRHGIALDLETIPIDDVATYALFQRGDTVGIFQYESAGMQKHLRDLKPTVFGDLIAMNALYRPGPLEYIPAFIRRKHGTEPISYDLPDMQEFLEETYGITVYQEQVMRLSQKLAGFSKGEADVLRKAMGKKDAALLAKLKPKFLEGGKERNHPELVLDKVWKDWEAFASYAFNKSHSTCYAWVAYQTAYLKANFPAEYMAAVLTNNMDDIKQVTFFMDESRRMKIPVLGPDVNESILPFTVNAQGAIRFGLGGMRGVGEGAVDHLVHVRTETGPFASLFDLVKRVDLRAINKGTMEALAAGGALDSLPGTHRGHFFYEESDGKPYLEKVRRYGQMFQDDAGSSQVSLFGASSEVVLTEPTVPDVPTPNALLVLKKEKEINGVYISAHPLDQFKFEMTHFVRNRAAELNPHEAFVNGAGFRDFTVAGMVNQAASRTTKTGRQMGSFVLEDKEGTVEIVLFGEDYLKYSHFLVDDQLLFVRGRVQKPSWGSKDGPVRYVIQVMEMKLLADVLSTAQKMEISLDLHQLTPAKLSEMHDVFSAYSGDKRVTFRIQEGEQGVRILGRSRNLRVRLERPLLEALESVVGEQAIKILA